MKWHEHQHLPQPAYHANYQEDWPEDPKVRAQIRADFANDPAIGDRRQELVFIGQVQHCAVYSGQEALFWGR
jgi:hypothetical protein